jgi:hypothetical protein
MKIRPLGDELFHADGRTDVTKLVVAFRSFVNAPKSQTSVTLTRIYNVFVVPVCVCVCLVNTGLKGNGREPKKSAHARRQVSVTWFGGMKCFKSGALFAFILLG